MARRKGRASCSSVTCILVRQTPKDVVRDFSGPLARKHGENRRKDGEEKEQKATERFRTLFLNGVGVPASGGVSFKNIPPNTPLVLVLSLPPRP